MPLRQTPVILAIALAATVPAAEAALAQTTAPPTSRAGAAEIAPDAVASLRRMSAYLGTLKTFEIRTQTTLDLVRHDDQTVQLDGSALYKVRRPDAFAIKVDSDRKSRVFVYDGKLFTIYAPHLGLYATAAAPGTIRETIAFIGDTFGVELPLADLFRWGDADADRAEKLQSAFSAGVATIDGVRTDQYVFREGAIDWQIWIQQGPQPLPRKIVISDRTDRARPTYTARLSWTLNPSFTSSDFAFVPDQDAKAIQLTRLAP